MRPALPVAACLILCQACAPAAEEAGPEAPDRQAAAAPLTVVYQGPLLVSPTDPRVRPAGVVSFRALGGAGTGYAWSLQGAGSGAFATVTGPRATFNATALPGRTETVQLTDASGGAGVTTTVLTTDNGSRLIPGAAGALSGDVIQFIGGTSWLVTGLAGSTIDETGRYVAGPGSQDAAPSSIDTVTADGGSLTAKVEVIYPYRVVPGRLILSKGEQRTFTVQGQVGAPTWSFPVNGSGGTFSNGSYTSGQTGGRQDLRATDSTTGAVAEAIVTVSTGLPLAAAATPATIAPGELIDLSASGGTGFEYTWSIQANGSGTLFSQEVGAVVRYTAGGTGTASGALEVKDELRLTDSSRTFVIRAFVISAPLAITQAPQPNEVITTGQTLTLKAAGGKHPYTWSVVQGPSRPVLVSLDSSATYTAGATPDTEDLIRVTDAVGTSLETRITVRAPLPSTGGCGSGAGAGGLGLLALLYVLGRRRPD